MSPSPSLVDSARALLRSLVSEQGIHASAADTGNYRAVFTRDAVIGGLAGSWSGDEHVRAGLLASIRTLARHMGPEGQVPSNVLQHPGEPARVSYGTLAPRIDSVSWFLLGAAHLVQVGAAASEEFAAPVARAACVLDALEFNGRHRLYVPVGGNWADEYLLEGYIAYDQFLRAWALERCAQEFRREDWVAKSRAIAGVMSERAWPAPGAGEPERWHMVASETPVERQDVFDLSAAAILGVSGQCDALAARVLDGIERTFLKAERLPPAFAPVYLPGSSGYERLRRYHLYEFRNRPYEYHNGGIWPVWIGWLALAFARHGRRAAATQLASQLMRALSARPYAFEEYLHGTSGEPGGVRDMAYSASGVLLASLATQEGFALRGLV